MSLVIPIAKDPYDRRDEQFFRDLFRRNIEGVENRISALTTDLADIVTQIGSFITLEMFGALGEDAVADKAAIEEAFAYLNSIGGGKIICKAGRTYYCDRVEPIVTTPIEWNLNGATLRRPDGVVTGNFFHMILFGLNSANAAVSVHGGTVNANHTNNIPVPPPSSSALQQNSSLYFNVASGIHANYVKTYDLVLLDRWNFDHIRVAATTSRSLKLFEFHNIRSSTAQSWTLRADVIWYQNLREITGANFDVQRIETEFTGDCDARQIARLTDGKTTELQIDGQGTTANLFELHLDDVVSDKTWLTDCCVFDRNCVFGNVQDIRIAKWRSIDTKLTSGDTGQPWSNATTVAADIDWKLVRPVFRLITPPQTTTNFAIVWPGFLTSRVQDNKIIMIEPDFLDEFGRIANITGTVEIVRPKIDANGTYAFFVSGVASREINFTLDSGDYSAVNAATMILSIDAWLQTHHLLTVKGDWFGDESRIVRSSTINETLIRNSRRVFRATDPASAIKGDELYITPPPSTPGLAVRKIATSTHGTTPAWQTIIVAA